MQKTRKMSLGVASLLALSGVAAYFVPQFVSANVPFIPATFLEARARGSVLAENIVSLSEESVLNLGKISDEDRIGNYSGGLNIIVGEISRNKLAREAALDLSKELEVMAANLSEVKPAKAVDIGLQAILADSQLVQRLVNYNGHAYELLNVLHERFLKNGLTGAREVNELLKKMNMESAEINDLNQKYRKLMAEFDALTQEKD